MKNNPATPPKMYARKDHEMEPVWLYVSIATAKPTIIAKAEAPTLMSNPLFS